MIDIPLSLRVPPQGRYNRGIYTCYECGFETPHYNVVPCMLGDRKSTRLNSSHP